MKFPIPTFRWAEVGGRGVTASAQRDSGVSSSTTEGWLTTLFGGRRTSSGAKVTVDTALAVAAVYRCVKIRSQTLGMLPLVLYKRKGADDRERAVDHPLYKLLKVGPNPNHTAYNFKRAMQAQVDLRGNGHSLIERDGAGAVYRLRPLQADRVVTRRDPESGALFYDIQGGEQNIPARRMLHLRGFTLDGDVGVNPIHLARESLGLALETEKAGAEAFSKGVVPPVIISVKGSPDKALRDQYRDDWVKQHSGNRHVPAVIGELVKAEQLAINLEDMQFLQSRTFQILEICRWYDVPPHMVFELTRATFSNIEHQGIEFLLYCMQPQLTNWEAELNRTLLTPDEQEEYYFEFLSDALLRTDVKTRWETYNIARNTGAKSANEIRKSENMSGYVGGDTYLEPTNMRRVGDEDDDDTAPAKGLPQ